MPADQGFSACRSILFAAPVLVEYFQKLTFPIHGGIAGAGGVSAPGVRETIERGTGDGHKRRIEANVAQVMNVIGDVKGRTCLVADDMIDTAGTLVKTVEALLEHGATKVYACGTHPVLSGPAVERIENSKLEEVVVTNTIPQHNDARRCKRIRVLSVGKLLARAVQSIDHESRQRVIHLDPRGFMAEIQ
jgi:ribose-phosphate pyrophosphokinase